MKLQIKKLHPNAKLPSFAHATDAGMDLFALQDVVVEPGCLAQIQTGIAIVLPEGHAGLIWDKSGISHKRQLKVMGGVFDSEYRGDYTIALYNLGPKPQEFKSGDKIAQLIIQKIEHPEIVEVDELDETARGEGRFGSTGI